MIVVVLLFLDFYMHDTVIDKSTAFHAAMQLEWDEEYEKQKSEAHREFRQKQMEQKAQDYLSAKTISQKNHKAFTTLTKTSVTVECIGTEHFGRRTTVQSKVRKTEPDEFIRKMSALREVIP